MKWLGATVGEAGGEGAKVKGHGTTGKGRGVHLEGPPPRLLELPSESNATRCSRHVSTQATSAPTRAKRGEKGDHRKISFRRSFMKCLLVPFQKSNFFEGEKKMKHKISE